MQGPASFASQFSTEAALLWIKTSGLVILGKAGTFVLIILGTLAISRILESASDRLMKSSRLHFSESLRSFAKSAVRKITVIVGIIMGLGTVGVNVGPVVAGLGVTGFILGFALKDTLANFAAGVMVLLYRPFDHGDFVKIGGHEGEVTEITLNATLVTTPDNRRIVIPNAKVWGDAIYNSTVLRWRRLEVTVAVPATQDLAKTLDVLRSTATQVHKSLEGTSPAAPAGRGAQVPARPEPEVAVVALGGGAAVTAAVRLYAGCGAVELTAAQDQLARAVRESLLAAGITPG